MGSKLKRAVASSLFKGGGFYVNHRYNLPEDTLMLSEQSVRENF
ncbi:hypothetical protein [Nitrosomonas sp.]|nr:hypothetical protein [Nitrosomonas sp.]